MSNLGQTQTGFSNPFRFDHRNRQGHFQWCADLSIRCREWAPGFQWSSSRFAGAAWGEGFLSRCDASDWDVDFQEAGNSSHKRITGTARDGDANGAIFASGAVVTAVLTATDIVQGTCVADAGGYFDCPTREGGAHKLTLYYASIPPKAGMSANTITPT